MKRLLVGMILSLLVVGNVATAQPDPFGYYEVQGQNPDGSRYEGTLELSQRGALIQVGWNFNGEVTVGTGVILENRLGVVYGGDTCGIAVYVLLPNGGLAGTWALIDGRFPGTEVATPTEDEGFYLISGTNPPARQGAKGTTYEGTLELSPFQDFALDFDPRGYSVSLTQWEAGSSSTGIGILVDGMFATAYGGDYCALAFYEVDRRGNWEGVWTAPLLSGVGTETLRRLD